MAVAYQHVTLAKHELAPGDVQAASVDATVPAGARNVTASIAYTASAYVGATAELTGCGSADFGMALGNVGGGGGTATLCAQPTPGAQQFHVTVQGAAAGTMTLEADVPA